MACAWMKAALRLVLSGHCEAHERISKSPPSPQHWSTYRERQRGRFWTQSLPKRILPWGVGIFLHFLGLPTQPQLTLMVPHTQVLSLNIGYLNLPDTLLAGMVQALSFCSIVRGDSREREMMLSCPGSCSPVLSWGRKVQDADTNFSVFSHLQPLLSMGTEVLPSHGCHLLAQPPP